MKNKGFTLVELLAVIIILAVITLIATPIVIDVIEKAQKSSAESSIAGYADAAKLARIEYLFVNSEQEINDLSGLEIVNSGEKVECEEVLYSPNCGIVLRKCELVNKKDTFYYYANGKVTYEQNDNECGVNVVNTITKVTKGLINGTEGNSYYDGKLLVGNQTNNFVWYSGFLWQIIGQDNNGDVKMITAENVTTIPYHSSSATYTNSHIYDWLNTYFLENVKDSSSMVITRWCVDAADATSGGPARTDCFNNNLSAKVGLLTIDEYNLIGGSNSFLKNNQYFWTSSANDSSNTWTINSSGVASKTNVGSANGVRPVIKLKSSTIISSGSGTSSNPYLLEETQNKTGKVTDIVTSGDYVKLNDYIYRVVTNKSSGIQIVYDGIFDFGETSYIPTLLELNDDSRLVNANWTTGQPVSEGFKATDYLKKSGNSSMDYVGFLRMGEMLASNSYTINNPRDHVLMTSYSDGTSLWYINYNGIAGYTIDFISLGIRPSIVINLNSTIGSGNGTYNNPYIIN